MTCKMFWGHTSCVAKKVHIWDLFFASQFVWPQHFLHGVTMINMDNFNMFNYNIIMKNNKFSLMDKHNRQLFWNIGIFSTHSKSKKKLPYGNFFPLFPCLKKINIFWRKLVIIYILKNFKLIFCCCFIIKYINWSIYNICNAM